MRSTLFSALALTALALAAGGCSQRSALAEPVAITVVRSIAAHPDQKPGTASVIHTPIGLDGEAKKALALDAIDWLKQDVLVVNLGGTGRRIDCLRVKGSTLFVQTTPSGPTGDQACLVAVIEKSRATDVVIEAN